MQPAAQRRGQAGADLQRRILGTEGSQPFVGLDEVSLPPGSARTFPATTAGASALQISLTGDDGAAVRRTFGVVSDQAAVTGAEPASSWVVLPAVAGSPAIPGLVLSNPGAEPVVVTLSYFDPGPDDTIEVTIPPGSTIQAPKEFRMLAPEVAVRAEASSGTFVPAAASYSLGREGLAAFAAAIGIPLPG